MYNVQCTVYTVLYYIPLLDQPFWAGKSYSDFIYLKVSQYIYKTLLTYSITPGILIKTIIWFVTQNWALDKLSGAATSGFRAWGAATIGFGASGAATSSLGVSELQQAAWGLRELEQAALGLRELQQAALGHWELEQAAWGLWELQQASGFGSCSKQNTTNTFANLPTYSTYLLNCCISTWDNIKISSLKLFSMSYQVGLLNSLVQLYL